eukprot:COSAG06_NODE_25782_length_628_cov_15.219282_1_plen_179_part_01
MRAGAAAGAAAGGGVPAGVAVEVEAEAVGLDPWAALHPNFGKSPDNPDWFTYVLWRLILMLIYLKVPAAEVVEMGSNRAMVLGELWKRVRDHPLRDKLLTGRYEKTLGDRDAKYFADGLERPKRGHRIAFGWDPVKGWGASSAKDKERKRKGSSAADRRGKKARASGAAAGLPPPPAHP